MTLEERLKSCSICKNREMDMERGLICRLTYEKPKFEGVCMDFQLDDIAEQKEKERYALLHENAPISGWLIVFLWLGLGVGGCGSVFMALKNIFENEFNIFFTLVHLGTTLILFGTGVYTIFAFYKRKSNAVALAKTYITMMVIDGILGMLLMFIAGDFKIEFPSVRPFIWSLIWYLYLSYSKQVETLFPTARRTWGKFEKYALTIFSIGYMTMLVMAFAQFSTNVILSTDGYFHQRVANIKADLPIVIGDFEATDVYYEDKTISFYYKINNVSIEDLDLDTFHAYVADSKQELLAEWDTTLAEDEFLAQCCAHNLTIIYNYVDRAYEFLYEIIITPEDYKDKLTGLYLPVQEEP